MDKAERILKKWLPKDKLDLNMLPPAISDILEHFLIPLNTDTPPLALLLQTELTLAQVVGYNRLKVITSTFTTPANLYGLIFMPSGEGKDRPLWYLRKYLAASCEEEFDKRAEQYYSEQQDKIQAEAEELYSSERRQKQHIEENKPRPLRKITGSGTAEGLTAVREAYNLADFGSTFVKISEFGSYIKAHSEAKEDFLRIITEIYDMGDSEAKDIKGEKGNKPVYGVPCNALLYSSLSGLVDGPGREKLHEFFNRGLARRSFVCYPEIMQDVTKTKNLPAMLRKREEQRARAIEEVAPELQEFFYLTYKNSMAYKSRVLAGKADDLYRTYEFYNQERAKLINPMKEEGFRAELKNRHWKTLKLATIISASNNTEEMEITEEELGLAIYQAELFGESFNKFFLEQPPTDLEQLYEFFKEHQKRWVSKMEIRKQNFVHPSVFAKWFEEMLGECENLAALEKKRIQKRPFGKNGIEYKLVIDT